MNKEKIELTGEQVDDVLYSHQEEVENYLLETNSVEYNKGKLLEELLELGELLVKQQTKWEGYKPTDDDLVEELGDVLFRLGPVIKIVGEKKVLERLARKILKIKGYIDEGKHKGEI